MRARRWWTIAVILGGSALAGLSTRALESQGPSARPPEVTDSAIAAGRRLFHGSGGCAACHGLEGLGTDSGPALALGVWLYGNDSYRSIRSRVIHGIPKAYSLHDLPMPMRGWNTMSDAEVDAVAAYVWWISHRKVPS
jgi:mono/diheme cytochrome c family protein